MRTAFAAGRSEPPGYGNVLARICGWCKTFASADDAVKASQGAPLSHGICERCKAKLFEGEAA